MKSPRHKRAVTLVEMLIVVAIIAILSTILINTFTRIDNQGKERLAKSTFAIIDAALAQFAEYGYEYKDNYYVGLKFPIDCNDFSSANLATQLSFALGTTITITATDHDKSYSGSEALYFLLSRIPESRKTLGEVDISLITDEGAEGKDMEIEIDNSRKSPVRRFIDPWGETIQYDYYDENKTILVDRDETKRNFPLLRSAGLDGEFNTDDDITNR